MATTKNNSKRIDDLGIKMATDLTRYNSGVELIIHNNGSMDITGILPCQLALSIGEWVNIRSNDFDMDWLGKFLYDETAD